ncbi:MAG: dockerin type I domain-containing protein [Candidatus Zixiibacteriota bacterium]
MRRCQTLFLVLSLCLFLGSIVSARGMSIESPVSSLSETQSSAIMPSDLRHVAVHDVGNLYAPIEDGKVARNENYFDPETGDMLYPPIYPSGSELQCIFTGGIWVGGIVNGDTLTSCLVDGWSREDEMFPDDLNAGGVIRTGDFADDEFVTVVTDTNSTYNATPLNLKVTQKSYSWADSLYDDFIIIDYTVSNIGDNDITDCWVGVFLDGDLYHLSNYQGYEDDCSGVLDVQLDESNPSSQTLIPYSFDTDGDPDETPQWSALSPRGAISMQLLGAGFTPEHINFNWWISNGTPTLDFGPRRAGTPEDPFYSFSRGQLGTPTLDKEKYYVLSHPEVDYDQLSTAVDQSGDGWLPPPIPSVAVDFATGYDTRFLLSFGPFDLALGDSMIFSLAIVAGDNVHVNASDFDDLFDAYNPFAFYNTLDFSELILHHQRAREVYLSGYTLPNPGPPVGLEISEFDDAFVDLVWDACDRPDIGGYNVYYRDTEGDNIWYQVNITPVADTTFSVSIAEPLHLHEFAVSAVTTDWRESAFSETVSIVPNAPHLVTGVELLVQGLYIALQWDIHPDDDILQYTIYRSIWGGEFEKFDSTAGDYLVDNTTESGVQYSYYITATNENGSESGPSEKVTGIPMALDRGILFIDASRMNITSILYDLNSYEDLYKKLSSRLPVTRHVILQPDAVTPVTFKQMSEYSHIVVFAEDRFADLTEPTSHLSLDAIGLYLSNGGRGLFISPSPDFSAVQFLVNNTREPRKITFEPGDIMYDVFKLDSAVENYGFIIDEVMDGDLQGCTPVDPDYPVLEADTMQLMSMPIPMNEFIPASGYMYPQPGVETIYAYNSSVADTSNQGQVNGIKYLGEDYQFVFFNFPLTAMLEDGNYYALLQALNDLGIDVYCGDANNDGSVNLGDAIYLIRYVFMGGPPPAVAYRADVNCDGVVNISDAVVIINYIFRDHALLRCCP